MPRGEALLFLFVFWIGPRISVQKLRRRGLLDALRRVRITDDAYVIETETVRTEFTWESFKRFREMDGAFCFYFKNSTFEYLSQHWLTAQQVQELLTFLPTAFERVDHRYAKIYVNTIHVDDSVGYQIPAERRLEAEYTEPEQAENPFAGLKPGGRVLVLVRPSFGLATILNGDG